MKHNKPNKPSSSYKRRKYSENDDDDEEYEKISRRASLEDSDDDEYPQPIHNANINSTNVKLYSKSNNHENIDREDDEGEDDFDEDEEEDYDSYDESDEDDASHNSNSRPSQNTSYDADVNIPLYERIERMKAEESSRAFNSQTLPRHIKQKNSTHISAKPNEVNKFVKEKKAKNAPATMRSNRPVPILRESILASRPKSIDPRFSEATGKLNYDKFMKRYSFLDKVQEQEVENMSKMLKKTKNLEKKEEIKQELDKAKQQMVERRRQQQVKKRLREIYSEETEKVKAGKTPFFLKKSAVKEVALKQRYDDLKKEGKLNGFLAKKRKRNASKDHRMLPSRRVSDSV